jgi:hypothetical protein
LLEALLDPDGRRRILLLADEGQGIYEKGFVFPQADDGWVQVELASNFRNARRIAQVLRRIGGPGSPQYAPEGFVPIWHEASSVSGAAGVVDAELHRSFQKVTRKKRHGCVGWSLSVPKDGINKPLPNAASVHAAAIHAQLLRSLGRIRISIDLLDAALDADLCGWEQW